MNRQQEIMQLAALMGNQGSQSPGYSPFSGLLADGGGVSQYSAQDQNTPLGLLAEQYGPGAAEEYQAAVQSGAGNYGGFQGVLDQRNADIQAQLAAEAAKRPPPQEVPINPRAAQEEYDAWLMANGQVVNGQLVPGAETQDYTPEMLDEYRRRNAYRSYLAEEMP